MTAYPAWTPASRPGIVPLQPLGFGTILTRSFSALRHNPRVLLGFALSVQALALIVAAVVIVAVGILTFSRLATLRPGSDEFETVMVGSIAITAVVAFAVTLAAGALGVIVQAVVVAEVRYAVLAEKLTLGRLWRQVRPVLWRLFGYTVLVLLALTLVVAVTIGLFVALTAMLGWFVILPIILVALAMVPLTLWLNTKLLLVTATIVIEHATIRGAIVRSWTLIRGRFWPALGISVLIGLVFGVLAQLVTLPMNLMGSLASAIFSPTGDDNVAVVSVLVVGLLTEALVVLLQAISVVVSSTASALIYIDCRMRREGLDLDLSAYVEQRDAGVAPLPDPYLTSIGRAMAPRPTGPTGYPPGAAPPAYAPYAAAPPYAAPSAPAAAGYPPPAAPAYPPPAAPAYPPPAAPPSAAPPRAAPPSAAPPSAAPASPPPAPPPAPPTPPEPGPEGPTRWTPPGGAFTP